MCKAFVAAWFSKLNESQTYLYTSHNMTCEYVLRVCNVPAVVNSYPETIF